jgi:hypothetical protein
MTLADGLALVVGVAVSFAASKGLAELYFIMSPTTRLVWTAFRFMQGFTLAVSVVVLARVALYRRTPTVAEWLGIFVGTSTMSDWPENLVASWLYSPPMIRTFSFVSLGWIKGGLWLVGVLIGLGLFRLGRNLWPPALKTILLAWLALLSLTGPLCEFGQRGADLFAPSDGFGSGASATLYREACLQVACWPTGLFFGVPTIGVLVERIAGRKWTWTEWMASGSSIMTGIAALLIHRRWIFDPSSSWFGGPWPAWVRILERLIMLTWVFGVVLTSWLILMRFGPGCARWIQGPADRNQPSSEGSDSASSIR